MFEHIHPNSIVCGTGVLLLAALVAGCPTQEVTAFGPEDSPEGKTYSQWSGEWLEWILAMPAEGSPGSGGPCDQNQPDDAFFLAGTFDNAPEETRECAISGDRPVLFPVLNFYGFACPEVIGEEDCPLTSEEGVLDYASAFPFGFEIELDVVIDGEPLEGLEDYLTYSHAFELMYTGDSESQMYEEEDAYDCAQPWPDDNVCDVPGGSPRWIAGAGYYVMLEPLPPGEHTLYIRGALPEVPHTAEVTYTLTAEK
jgi:hypothetical protein